jgi:hypothetical protein
MNSTKGDNTPTNTLREFTQSQELFDAYKKYLSLDDMTMVEFANIMYPLVSEAVNKARIEELEATVINPIAGKSCLE